MTSEDEQQLSQLSCVGQSTDATSTRVTAVKDATRRLNDIANSVRRIVADIEWRGDANDAAQTAFITLAHQLNDHADTITALAEADDATAAPMHQAYLDWNTLQTYTGEQCYAGMEPGESVDDFRARKAKEFRQNLDTAMQAAQGKVVNGVAWDLEPPTTTVPKTPPKDPKPPVKHPEPPVNGSGSQGSGGSGGSSGSGSGGSGGSSSHSDSGSAHGSGTGGGTPQVLTGAGHSGSSHAGGTHHQPVAHVEEWHPAHGNHHAGNGAHGNGAGHGSGHTHDGGPVHHQGGQWHEVVSGGQWQPGTGHHGSQWHDTTGHVVGSGHVVEQTQPGGAWVQDSGPAQAGQWHPVTGHVVQPGGSWLEGSAPPTAAHWQAQPAPWPQAGTEQWQPAQAGEWQQVHDAGGPWHEAPPAGEPVAQPWGVQNADAWPSAQPVAVAEPVVMPVDDATFAIDASAVTMTRGRIEP